MVTETLQFGKASTGWTGKALKEAGVLLKSQLEHWRAKRQKWDEGQQQKELNGHAPEIDITSDIYIDQVHKDADRSIAERAYDFKRLDERSTAGVALFPGMATAPDYDEPNRAWGRKEIIPISNELENPPGMALSQLGRVRSLEAAVNEISRLNRNLIRLEWPNIQTANTHLLDAIHDLNDHNNGPATKSLIRRIHAQQNAFYLKTEASVKGRDQELAEKEHQIHDGPIDFILDGRKAMLMVSNSAYRQFTSDLHELGREIADTTGFAYNDERRIKFMDLTATTEKLGNQIERSGPKTILFTNFMEAYAGRNEQANIECTFFTKSEMQKYRELIPEMYVKLTGIKELIASGEAQTSFDQAYQDLSGIVGIGILAENGRLTADQEVAGYYATISDLILNMRDNPSAENPSGAVFNYLLKHGGITDAKDAYGKRRYTINEEKMRTASRELVKEFAEHDSIETMPSVEQDDFLANSFAGRYMPKKTTITYELGAREFQFAGGRS